MNKINKIIACIFVFVLICLGIVFNPIKANNEGLTGLNLQVEIMDLHENSYNDVANATTEYINTKALQFYYVRSELYEDWLIDWGTGVAQHGNNSSYNSFSNMFNLYGTNNEVQAQNMYYIQYGTSKNIAQLFNGAFVEGNYYSIQSYDCPQISWEVEGLDEYKIIGTSIYFQYKSGCRLTCKYHFYDDDNDVVSAKLNVILDDNGYSVDPYKNIEDADNSWAYHYRQDERTLPDNFQYIIKNELGEYVVFENINSHLFYVGTSSEPYIIENLKGMNNLYNMPEGTYTLEQLDTVEKYLYDSEIKTFVVDRSVPVVKSINIFDDSMFILYQWYTDPNGPKGTKKYHVKLKSSSAAKNESYEYQGLDEEGNRVYYWVKNPTSTSTTEIEIDEKTILYGTPMGMIYTLENLDQFAGGYLTSYYESYCFNYSGPIIIRQQMYDNTYGITKVEKTDVQGNPIDASFYISVTSDYVYKFKHHDELEFNGVIYNNVYEIIYSELKEDMDEDNIVSTIDGEAYVYYPIYHANIYSGMNTSWYPEHAFYDGTYITYLDFYEVSTDKNYIASNKLKAETDINISGSWQGRTDNNSKYALEEFQKITHNRTYDYTESVTIQNKQAPVIQKVLTNANTGTFYFDIYEGERYNNIIGEVQNINLNVNDKLAYNQEYVYDVDDANGYIIEFAENCYLSGYQSYLKIFDINGNELYSYDYSNMASRQLVIDKDYLKIVINASSSSWNNTKRIIANITPIYKEAVNYQKINTVEVKAGETFYLNQYLEDGSAQLEFGKPYKIVERISENYKLNSISGQNGVVLNEDNNQYFEFWFEDDLNEVYVTFSNTRLIAPLINLNIQKVIVGDEEDYYRLKIKSSDNFNFKISLKEQSSGKLINGILTTDNNLIISNLPEGVYTISESSEMLFDLFDIELLNSIDGVSLRKINNQYILEINGIDFNKVVDLKIINNLQEVAAYEKFEEKINLFLTRSNEIDIEDPEAH